MSKTELTYNENITELPTLEQIKRKCESIQAAVNEIIPLAKKERGTWRSEPINWAHLTCVDAEFTVNCDGDYVVSYYSATIEEADPSCVSFRRFVQAELRKRGLGGVEVRTEW